MEQYNGIVPTQTEKIRVPNSYTKRQDLDMLLNLYGCYGLHVDNQRFLYFWSQLEKSRVNCQNTCCRC